MSMQKISGNFLILPKKIRKIGQFAGKNGLTPRQFACRTMSTDPPPLFMYEPNSYRFKFLLYTIVKCLKFMCASPIQKTVANTTAIPNQAKPLFNQAAGNLLAIL